MAGKTNNRLFKASIARLKAEERKAMDASHIHFDCPISTASNISSFKKALS